MTRPNKQQLPKHFEELLATGSVPELIAIFSSCPVDARGGYSDHVALAFDECPDGLARWLVDHGADLEAMDPWGNTPLHRRSRSVNGRIASLIELGADVNSPTSSVGTPLHAAADSHNVENVRVLIESGGRPNALNPEGMTPLELALRSCTNSAIEKMAPLARVLLAAGAKKTDRMRGFVTEIGRSFEFHRTSFRGEWIDAADRALAQLYELFDTPPLPRREVHDGLTLIRVSRAAWQDQHEELWQLLVPSRGPAATVQGELIRISGRIGDERERNGMANWDREYAKMAAAFLVHLEDGNPLSAEDLAEAERVVEELGSPSANTSRLYELAVKWVVQNPSPFELSAPPYTR